MNYPRRVAVLLVLVVALLANFWLGSRYPAIDEKAAMAGEVVMGDVLSFDAHFPVNADDPLWRKIGYSTVNWSLTNRQGMTFGVLLATLILTILKYWRPKPGRGNPFADAIKGVLIGTPLGVCVNCAAPIAFGMRQQGLSAGTSLATMFASPTLNVLVLAMTFSILPFYMGVTKVAVTLFFIVVILPLLVGRAGDDAAATTGAQIGLDAKPGSLPAAESWPSALWRLVPDLLRSFGFIFIRTVPLMLLAGFLGATMAHLVPLDSLGGWEVTFAAMAGVALLGTFAPVPIAFDVVIVQALLMAGLAPPFAMVLLLTLGLFSIYPWLIVSRIQSCRFASQLFVAVAVVGVVTGYGSLAWENHVAAREARIFTERFEGRAAEPRAGATLSAAVVDAVPGLQSAGDRLWPLTAGVHWSGTPMAKRSPAGPALYQRYRGEDLGLRPVPLQAMDFMLPFSQGRGIAAADFDGDGLPDLAVANNRGVDLYRNRGGAGFERLELPPTALDEANVLMVAFADLDDDGCLDLFAGTVGDADFVLANGCNGFADGRLAAISHDGGFLTQAAAFADLDRDGDLDVFRGSWFFLIPRVAGSERNRNHILWNRGGLRFESSVPDEIHGETLTVLASDLDLDGLADLVAGNDYQEPDIYWRGVGGGEFVQWRGDGPVPVSTNATMSIDTADFDNDGDLDLFLTGKVNDFSMRRELTGPATSLSERRTLQLQHRANFEQRYCALYEDAGDLERCQARFRMSAAFRRSMLDACEALGTPAEVDECMITLQIKNALIRHDWSFCAQIPGAEFPVHLAICEAYAEHDANRRPKDPGYLYEDRNVIPQKMQGNVLLVRQPDGRYLDRSAELGVEDAVWAWNGRFGDVDLDGWQDLYVVNGWWLETSMYTNVLFHNREGRGFEPRQREFGLERFIKQHASVFLDLDADGDLDIVSRGLDGAIDIYVNGSQEHRAIAFELRDKVGNRFGIGSRVSVVHGAGGMRQMREIKLGGGFVSFDPPVAHFGLGGDTAVARVEIDWSDGTRTVIDEPLEAGQRYRVSRTAAASAVEAASP